MPTELLLEILQDNDLSTDDLYNLGVLSRRLNHLALPIFLSRQGIPHPENKIILNDLVYETSMFEESKGCLSGLSIATYLSGKTVETMECHFRGKRTSTASTPVQNLYPESRYVCCIAVQRISNFIQNLASIKSVTLRLIGSDGFKKSQSSELRVLNWTKAFEGLLNLIIEKGATSLHVHYNSDLNPEQRYQFIEKTTVEKVMYRIKNIVAMPSDLAALDSLAGPWWKFQPPSNGKQFPTYQPKLSSKAQQNCVLRTLTINSSVFLTPPFLGWMLHLASSNKAITSLNLNFVGVHREFSRAILPPLSELLSSKLTEFTVSSECWMLPTYELLRFLTHVPKLAKLTIDHSIPFQYTYYTDPKVQHPVPLLANCEFLDASHQFVLYFLTAHSQFIPQDFLRLPKLTSLVTYPSSTSAMYDIGYFESSARDWTVLYEHLYKAPAITSLERAEPVSCSLKFSARIFDISHTIVEYFRTSSEYESLEMQSNTLAVFQNIAEIKFQYFNSPDDEQRVFFRSLGAIFPDLKRLTFTHYIYQPYPTSALNLLTEFRECLRRECSHVESISIAGQIFRIHDDDDVVEA